MVEYKVMPRAESFFAKGCDREKCRRADIASNGSGLAAGGEVDAQDWALGMKLWFRAEIERHRHDGKRNVGAPTMKVKVEGMPEAFER
jgi:hypothetical protein